MNLRSFVAATVVTAIALAAGPAHADPSGECREARALLRSEKGRKSCHASHLAARTLSCSSTRGAPVLLRMANSCKARLASPTPPSGAPTSAPTPSEPKPPKKAGGQSSITAYAMDGKTVLDVVSCSVDPVSGPRYPECLAATKTKLQANPSVCPSKGPTVKFKYRMGDIEVLLIDKVGC